MDVGAGSGQREVDGDGAVVRCVTRGTTVCGVVKLLLLLLLMLLFLLLLLLLLLKLLLWLLLLLLLLLKLLLLWLECHGGGATEHDIKGGALVSSRALL